MKARGKEKISEEVNSQAVLVPFLNLLRSVSPILLPRETLYGAITHFLTTLPPPHLTTFTETLVSSPSLWAPESSHADEVRRAIRLAVSAKVSVIEEEFRDAYFSGPRHRRAARRWLHVISRVIIASEVSTGRTHLLAGLLLGIGDTPRVDWGEARVNVEEEVVMSLAPLLESRDGRGEEARRLLYSAISFLSEERLQVLDLEVRPVPNQRRRR